MKVLVTGGVGFIGSRVIAKLLQEKCKVVVIDNLSTGLKANVPKDIKVLGHVTGEQVAKAYM